MRNISICAMLVAGLLCGCSNGDAAKKGEMMLSTLQTLRDKAGERLKERDNITSSIEYVQVMDTILGYEDSGLWKDGGIADAAGSFFKECHAEREKNLTTATLAFNAYIGRLVKGMRDLANSDSKDYDFLIGICRAIKSLENSTLWPNDTLDSSNKEAVLKLAKDVEDEARWKKESMSTLDLWVKFESALASGSIFDAIGFSCHLSDRFVVLPGDVVSTETVAGKQVVTFRTAGPSGCEVSVALKDEFANIAQSLRAGDEVVAAGTIADVSVFGGGKARIIDGYVVEETIDEHLKLIREFYLTQAD